jgi:hypothetical protein
MEEIWAWLEASYQNVSYKKEDRRMLYSVNLDTISGLWTWQWLLMQNKNMNTILAYLHAT